MSKFYASSILGIRECCDSTPKELTTLFCEQRTINGHLGDDQAADSGGLRVYSMFPRNGTSWDSASNWCKMRIRGRLNPA